MPFFSVPPCVESCCCGNLSGRHYWDDTWWDGCYSCTLSSLDRYHHVTHTLSHSHTHTHTHTHTHNNTHTHTDRQTDRQKHTHDSTPSAHTWCPSSGGTVSSSCYGDGLMS